MYASFEGIVKGKQIDLDRDSGLTSGTRVEVMVRPKLALSLAERKRKIEALCGSCADDPTFAAAVAEIVRDRKKHMPREIEFDATP